MSSFVIDASVWVARLLPQDGHHASAKTWMNRQREAGNLFISPAILLPEVSGAVSRRTGDAHLALEVIKTLTRLSGLRIMELTDGLLQMSAVLAANLHLRGADSIYVAAAYNLRIPLISLDQDQNERASLVVETILPE